jgi:hypothetical protein
MKTTIEVHGYEIVIEETEMGVSVSAMKDDETLESFELDLEGGSEDMEDDDMGGDYDDESDFEDEDFEEDELETKPMRNSQGQAQGQRMPQGQGQRMPQAQGQRMPQAQGQRMPQSQGQAQGQKMAQAQEEQTLESFGSFIRKNKTRRK